jgi:hypothetical protein
MSKKAIPKKKQKKKMELVIDKWLNKKKIVGLDTDRS